MTACLTKLIADCLIDSLGVHLPNCTRESTEPRPVHRSSARSPSLRSISQPRRAPSMAAPDLPPPPASEAMSRDQPILQSLLQSQPSLGLQGTNTRVGLGTQQVWQNQQLPLVLLNLLASAFPLGLANPAQIASFEQIHPLLTKNLQSITEMNRNLFDALEAMQGKGGMAMEAGSLFPSLIFSFSLSLSAYVRLFLSFTRPFFLSLPLFCYNNIIMILQYMLARRDVFESRSEVNCRLQFFMTARAPISQR